MSAFSWQNSISLCPAAFSTPRPNLPVAAAATAAASKWLQSCLTQCSPPGSPVPGILQARTLEWVAISFSNAWKWKVKVKSLSCVWLLATPWTAAHQPPPSMGFSRQEYWSGVPLPLPKFACYSRYFLTSCFCIPVPYNKKDIFLGVSSRRSRRSS